MLTNKTNGKYYVGQCTREWKYRWALHKSQAKGGQRTHICSAIRKYGPEVFEMQELATTTTQEELDRLEVLWILVLDARNPEVGYNLALGGQGGKPMLGRKFSAEHRKKLSDSRIGMKFSEEHRSKLSKAKLNNPVCYWLGKSGDARLKNKKASSFTVY